MKRYIIAFTALIFAVLVGVLMSTAAQSKVESSTKAVDDFLVLLSNDSRDRDKAFSYIEEEWQPGFAIMAVEVI
ncbi:MAG: hypothetical protein GXP21_09070, partial [Gammaproteobacteria bacterium]|nr:hypothetical protein [Gammaproteobacteria bacterium]